MSFKNTIPEWNNTGTEPSESMFKTASEGGGFKGGYKPPAGIFNWFWNRVTKCINEIQTKIMGISSTKTDVVLRASDWAGGVYQWNNENITSAEQIIELVPRQGISVNQLTALQYANIVGTSQSVGSVTLTAYGEVPTIDIPVTFIVRGDV